MSPIQRRSPGGRLLLGSIYVLLTFGAAWMVYPFLLLASGSIKSEVDIRQFDVLPRYLYDDEMLFRKFEEQRYGTIDAFTEATRQVTYGFDMVEKPRVPPAALMQDWRKFIADAKFWPMPFLQLGHNRAFRTVPELSLEFNQRLARAGAGEVTLAPENWGNRTYSGYSGVIGKIYYQMRSELPLRYFRPTPVDGIFIGQQLRPKYGIGADAVQKLNQKWGTRYSTLSEVTLATNPPNQPGQREDWWEFVRETISFKFIHFSPALMPLFRDFLRSKYREIAELNRTHGTAYESWEKVPYPQAGSKQVAFSDAEDFVRSRKTPEGISLDTPDSRWRTFLREKYGDDLEALNREFGSRYESFDVIPMPILESDWRIMQENRYPIIRDFATRNFVIVYNYLTGRGRAFFNTIVFCALNVLTALIVNPLAAYALSRFQPRWGYKILFFLMATMAFPGEVTQIPNFLMLRELGLLNTFAALVIPAAANGYSIFLLKGFFDSLPRDLYESANLDGASELRIFWSITVPLSMPILAVIALGAFTAAYGAFMFALLVCQKESMWTLMVYIFQLQQTVGSPVVFASLIIAAIPTLLVFVFCQNIIMRGIVVPVEK